VTNSGYGCVKQAMSLGVPLVCAGLTEEGRRKRARRMFQDGDQPQNEPPTSQMLRGAIRIVLCNDRYCLHASLLAEEFQLTDTRGDIIWAIRQVSQNSADGFSPKMAAQQGQRR
jgi:UDP:flavonoid glycosyltransferase YjiC (YdhE family)